MKETQKTTQTDCFKSIELKKVIRYSNEFSAMNRLFIVKGEGSIEESERVFPLFFPLFNLAYYTTIKMIKVKR